MSCCDRLERLRKSVDMFRVQYERCENPHNVRVGARTGEYVVLEQRVANLDGRTVTDHSEQ
jgi:hypothetical protein